MFEYIWMVFSLQNWAQNIKLTIRTIEVQFEKKSNKLKTMTDSD